jgi:hypothetical protein
VLIRLDNAILRKHIELHLPISYRHWSYPNCTTVISTNASDFSCRFNRRDSQRLYLNDDASLMNSHISAIDPTVVFIHGFTQMADSLSASTVRDGKLLNHIGALVATSEVDCVWNVMVHAQKQDFVFRRNGRVHLNRRGRQFGRLLAAEVCASAVVMLDTTPCSEVVWRYWLPTPFASFPFTSPPVRHRVPSHFNWTLSSKMSQ